MAGRRKIDEAFRVERPSAEKTAIQLEIEQLERENAELRARIDLPFLYGWKWYPWARKFYDSKNRVNLLCAANQISKSSTQIRKCINWATDQDEWPDLWVQKPIQFWYLYPTQKQVNAEFETKWKQFLPKGEMKNDPYYGWKTEKDGKSIVAIHFNSGVHVYFKTYMQSATALQTGTCDAIFCDEELPEALFDELMLRISASDGYFHMVFTATLGQDFWRRAMEPAEMEKENLPEALKMSVSLYEAMEYEDGTRSHWTIEKIKRIEARCSTHLEVLKRVFGKFVVTSGRKYESFDIKKHMRPKPEHPLPTSWLVYEGADIGGGGEGGDKGHMSAICFIAVRPDFREGRVFLGWRGDKQNTTAGDVFQKHQEMKKTHKLNITQKWYDWGNKDFGEIATRAGDSFEKAEKSHEIGEGVINTLFKHNMLTIYEDEELCKLGAELAVLRKDTPKKRAKDDFADAFRYGVTKIPWDWSALNLEPVEIESKNPDEGLTDIQKEVRERRKAHLGETEKETHEVESEIEEWNAAYGNSGDF